MPRQRNTREENALIKEGQVPEAWDKPEAQAKRRQKDTQARWTKKNDEKHYGYLCPLGYKNHINSDEGNKLIQNYSVTHAAVHDSQVFDELLGHEADADGNKRAVYADSAYRSEAQEQLADTEIASQICEKGTRGKPLTEGQKQSNRTKSKVRARVEHVFGAQAAMGGHLVRTIGLARAKVKIGLMNLVYNMKRLVQLIKRDMQAAKGDLTGPCREGAPEMA